MAIAHDAASESHTGALGSISEASFSWSHGGAAAGVDGVLIFVVNTLSTADNITSVTYGGVNVPAVTGGRAVDTVTEPMSCKAFFLGATDIPQGTQTVVVNRTNNTDEMYAVAITVTASVAGKIGAVHEAGIILLEENGTLAEQSVDDGTPGTDSVRYAGIASGLGAPPAAGASSTELQSIDFGVNVARVVRETTAGQGSRSVGFSSGTSDDRAAVHLAVKEVDGVGGPTAVPVSDTTAVSVTEAQSSLVSSDRPDTAAVTLTEAQQSLLSSDRPDTAAIAVDEVVGVSVLIEVLDTVGVATTETSDLLINEAKAVSDTVALALTEAQNSLLSSGLADSVALVTDEAIASFLASERADSLELVAADVAASLLLSDVVDSLGIGVSEAPNLAVLLQTADAVALGVSEVSALAFLGEALPLVPPSPPSVATVQTQGLVPPAQPPGLGGASGSGLVPPAQPPDVDGPA